MCSAPLADYATTVTLRGGVFALRSAPLTQSKSKGIVSREIMIRSVAGKVLWVGRATVFLVGLAVILALVFGVASTAFGHGGYAGLFHLGHNNNASNPSTLTKSGAGPALSLRVGGGAPLAVNSGAKVANLNADMVDGLSFSCPRGTFFHEGVCIETTTRTGATHSTAQGDCFDELKRLPTVAELQTFRNRAGQDMSPESELTGQLDYTGSAFFVHRVGTNGSVELDVTTSTGPYRCVSPALH